MGTSADIAYVENGIIWWKISPDIGHPECRCSSCLDVIREGSPLRMWREFDDPGCPHIEARFCRACQQPCTGVPYAPSVPDEDDDW